MTKHLSMFRKKTWLIGNNNDWTILDLQDYKEFNGISNIKTDRPGPTGPFWTDFLIFLIFSYLNWASLLKSVEKNDIFIYIGKYKRVASIILLSSRKNFANCIQNSPNYKKYG